MDIFDFKHINMIQKELQKTQQECMFRELAIASVTVVFVLFIVDRLKEKFPREAYYKFFFRMLYTGLIIIHIQNIYVFVFFIFFTTYHNNCTNWDMVFKAIMLLNKYDRLYHAYILLYHFIPIFI